jgi:hypothetical protein
MDEIIKSTYDEVQAALLNSEQEPQWEIFTALCAVTDFADGEGMTSVHLRGLLSQALQRLEKAANDASRPPCFGRNHSPGDPLCSGGEDVTYEDGDGSHTRQPCDFFVSCGEALAKTSLIPSSSLLQKRGKRAAITGTEKRML